MVTISASCSPASLPGCAQAAREAPRHRGRDAAFVKEYEPFRIDREDALMELGATDSVGFGGSFGQHTATVLAALIGLQYPYPQIVRIGSSHPYLRGHCAREYQDRPYSRMLSITTLLLL